MVIGTMDGVQSHWHLHFELSLIFSLVSGVL